MNKDSLIELSMHEAKTHLSKYVAMLNRGVKVVIKRGNVPAARLVAFDECVEEGPKRPAVGTVTSQAVSYSEDCFAALSANELLEWGI